MSYSESVIQGVNCRLGNKKYRAVICQPDIILTLCAIDADIAVNCSALSGFVFMFQSNEVPIPSAWVIFRQIHVHVFPTVRRLHP